MANKRQYISRIWICDYCHNIYEGKDLGFKKENYTLCKNCKHMSIEAIKRNKI